MRLSTKLLKQKKKKAGYRYFGIRSIPKDIPSVNIGDVLANSYDWDYENDCSRYLTDKKELPGVSTIYLDDGTDDLFTEIAKKVEYTRGYRGQQCVLVGSTTGCEWGDDWDELILEEGVVLYIID